MQIYKKNLRSSERSTKGKDSIGTNGGKVDSLLLVSHCPILFNQLEEGMHEIK
jgi:hypothetical protein